MAYVTIAFKYSTEVKLKPTLVEFMKSWEATPEKIDEAVRRLVTQADPLQVILFGSRARGDHSSDSDVDLAVIVDAPEPEVSRRVNAAVLSSLRLQVTLIAVSKEKFDEHRPWVNSVFHAIDREGVILYERGR